MGKSVKHIFLAALALVYWGSAAVANSTDQEDAGIKTRIKIQESRLEDIKTYVGEQKQLIENSYEFMAGSVENGRVEYLEQFAASLRGYIRPQALTLRGLIEVYGQLTRVDRQVTSDRFFSQETIGLSPEKVTAGDIIYAMESNIWSRTRMDNVAQRLVTDMESFDAELLQLERRKAVALEQLAKWEQWRREEVVATISEIRTSAAKNEEGVIIAISYGYGKPSVMIGEKILYEGDTISGAKVVKIGPEQVEFNKAGVTSVRQLGSALTETPNK